MTIYAGHGRFMPADLAAFQRDSRAFMNELAKRRPPVVLFGDKERAAELFARLAALVEKYGGTDVVT